MTSVPYGGRLRNMIRDSRPPPPELTETNYPDLTGKTILITGTSAGVGKEAAKLLLSKNATVVAVNRNREKTATASQEIIAGAIELNETLAKSELSTRLIDIFADLSDLTTIKPAAVEVAKQVKKLDIIILNAGVMTPPKGSITKQGYELQFGCNVMAHQLLFDLVLPLVKKSAATGTIPRVVFTSSSAHGMAPPNGGMSWDFRNTELASTTLYGQSKAGNIYQAAIATQQNPDIISLAVHPGFLASELQRHFPAALTWLAQKLIMHHPRYGAYTELWAALNPVITTVDSGKYVGPWGVFHDMRSDIEEGRSNGTAQKMMDWVEKEIQQYK